MRISHHRGPYGIFLMFYPFLHVALNVLSTNMLPGVGVFSFLSPLISGIRLIGEKVPGFEEKKVEFFKNKFHTGNRKELNAP